MLCDQGTFGVGNEGIVGVGQLGHCGPPAPITPLSKALLSVI